MSRGCRDTLKKLTRFGSTGEGEQPIEGSIAVRQLMPVMPETDVPGQASDFEFLQCTGNDFKPFDVTSRRLIRSHVMKNYCQEKRSQATTLSSASSASTMNARNKLKRRWRLDSSSKMLDDVQSNTQQRPSKTCSSASRGNSQQSRSRGELGEPLGSVESDKAQRRRFGVSMSQLEELTLRHTTLEQFQAERIDPFNTLPVQTGKRVDRLMSFYTIHFTINSIAVNPTRTWYNYVMRDPGLFNGMLSTVALYMHSHVGISVVREDILFHRGETMKIINTRLASMTGVDASNLIGVIATILSFENLCGNYFTSKAHLEALRRLIQFVGGMEQFNYNDSLGRAVAWSEFHFAAAHRIPSPFQYISATYAEFPEDLLTEAVKTSPTSLITLPVYGGTIYNIFRRIHRLGLSVSFPWMPFVDRVAISNLLLETEYDMLLLSSQVGSDSTKPERDEDLIAFADALVTAAQIFVFVALRNMPVRARIVEIYFSRLRPVLERSDLIAKWQAYCSSEALLWALFMTASAARGNPERAAVLAEIKRVAALLGLRTGDEVEHALRSIAWADFFRIECDAICVETFRRQSEPT
ncbi:hypothetical protein EJ08DRAFT_440158 [Tothia fuscella]|uniref:Uncharacterized protein n=1 Tax=Tothia fuscella TaxID=1048955 RepID=A0A9P4NJ45_9PEZI|nr:hypothetical protein EJ08DRAFT_440158 [Tothia fuscella]